MGNIDIKLMFELHTLVHEGKFFLAQNVCEHLASGNSRVQLEHIDGRGMTTSKFSHDKREYII